MNIIYENRHGSNMILRIVMWKLPQANIASAVLGRQNWSLLAMIPDEYWRPAGGSTLKIQM